MKGEKKRCFRLLTNSSSTLSSFPPLLETVQNCTKSETNNKQSSCQRSICSLPEVGRPSGQSLFLKLANSKESVSEASQSAKSLQWLHHSLFRWAGGREDLSQSYTDVFDTSCMLVDWEKSPSGASAKEPSLLPSNSISRESALSFSMFRDGELSVSGFSGFSLLRLLPGMSEADGISSSDLDEDLGRNGASKPAPSLELSWSASASCKVWWWVQKEIYVSAIMYLLRFLLSHTVTKRPKRLSSKDSPNISNRRTKVNVYILKVDKSKSTPISVRVLSKWNEMGKC